MNLEFPTLKIALAIQTVHTLIKKIILDKQGIMESNGNHITIKKKYLLTLDRKAVEERLNRAASRRLHSREYLFFFFGFFFLAIFTELFILKVFFGNESEKTIPYFRTDNAKKETEKIVLIRNTSTTPTHTRGLQPWVATLLVVAGGSSFFALYRSRKDSGGKIEILKKEIIKELDRKNLDVRFEKRSELFHLDLVDYGQSTEIIFFTEKGSPLINHFITTMVTVSRRYGSKNRPPVLIIGNWALQQLLQQFREQRVRGWDIEPETLTYISFSGGIEEDTDNNFP